MSLGERDTSSRGTSLEVTVKTRFAPSPTGYLHLGNARIALINYIVAAQEGGSFLLRIEDTDVKRSDPAFVQGIMEDLTWLGVVWEGEPVFQSTRLSLYKEKAFNLWSKGLAYPCFCTPHELEAHRQECLKRGRPPRYSGKCRGLSMSEVQARIAEGEPYVLRLKVSPSAIVEWKDPIKGRKRFRGKDLDDIILLRCDGTPTYHLAMVVDDGEAGITHVIRGEDHLSNTPYHILLFEGLDYPVPIFAHVPLVYLPEGHIMEKREGSSWTLRSLRDKGYLPLAVVNLLVTLGWNPPHSPPLSWSEILESFHINELSSSPVTFSPSTLASINKKLLAALTVEELLEALRPYLPSDLPTERLEEAVVLMRGDSSTLVELALWVERLLRGPHHVDLTPEEKRILEELASLRREHSTWDAALEKLGSELGRRGRGMLYQTFRKALLGVPYGPPINELLDFLKDEVESRMRSIVGFGNF